MPCATCSLSTPPPQDLYRSGGLPACMLVVSFFLNASFSIGCATIFTFEWAFWYWVIRSSQIGLRGSPVWMCHQLIVWGPLAAGGALSPPHAANSAAPALAAPRPRNDLREIFRGVAMSHPCEEATHAAGGGRFVVSSLCSP